MLKYQHKLGEYPWVRCNGKLRLSMELIIELQEQGLRRLVDISKNVGYEGWFRAWKMVKDLNMQGNLVEQWS